jgi:hypothetical protein
MLSQSGNWVGPNPYKMLEGFPEIMEACGVEVGDRPTKESLRQLLQRFGRKNEAGIATALHLSEGQLVPNDRILDLIEGTGVLEEMPMRTVRGAGEVTGLLTVIMLGGTVTEMEQRVARLQAVREANQINIGTVYALPNTRGCDRPEELNDSRVIQANRARARPVREPFILRQLLAKAGYSSPRVQICKDGIEAGVNTLVEWHEELGHAQFYVPAADGALFASLRARRAVLNRWPAFDRVYDQMWFDQAGRRLARTLRQARDAHNFVPPLKVIADLVELVYELSMLKSGEQLS